MQTLNFYLKHPKVIGNIILNSYCHWMPSRLYLRLKFRLWLGKWPDLKHPKSFNEKMQWIKLYDHNPRYTMMVDKVKVKEYVSSLLGEEYIIPTIGIWDDPDKIDFNELPDRFVLKCNHNSGLGMCICKNKSLLDEKKVRKNLRKGLRQNYFYGGREWPYKDVPRRILAESFIDPVPDLHDLPEYKWYCFNGEPLFCQEIVGGRVCSSVNFNEANGIPQDRFDMRLLENPQSSFHFITQLEIVRELSKSIPFSRILLYETGKSTFYGECFSYKLSEMKGYSIERHHEMLEQMQVKTGEKAGSWIIQQSPKGKLHITTPDLQDFKIYCFNGEPKIVMVSSGRFSDNMTFDYYDVSWKRVPIRWGADNSTKDIEPPVNFGKMLELSRKLSSGLPHVRVDMYNVCGRLYFGELTFFDSSGFGRIEPTEWDDLMGSWLILPEHS